MRQIACAAVVLSLALAAGLPAARAAPSTEARLRQALDVQEIERLLVDYGRALDRRDFSAYAALFARDGTWDGGFGKATGPAAIEAMMRKSIGGALVEGPQRTFHILTNFDIRVEGDSATAWSHWTFMGAGPDGAPRPLFAGRYEDQLVREDGRWRFKRRVALTDLPAQPPAPAR